MPKLRVNRKLEPLLMKSKPIKVAIGGRGSGKSIGFGDIFTMKMEVEKADIYCLREYMDSLEDSVHRVFKSSVQERLQLPGWEILKNTVIAPNGAHTTYKGASRNTDGIQSAQAFKYSWFEEAHRASKESLDKLLPTILRNPGAECWFSANPQKSTDPFSQRFIVPYLKQLTEHGYYEDDVHLIVVVNWRDNPWWNKEQEMLRAWDYENRPRVEYDWIWEGKFNDQVDDSIMKAEWIDAAIDAHEKIPGIDRGVRSAGFDPADSGDDDKAIATRHGGLITSVYGWPEGDLGDAVDKAFDIAFENRVSDIVYDSIGVGAGVRPLMAERVARNNITLTSFVGGDIPDYPDQKYMDDRFNQDVFRNKRAQYWWLLRDRFENTYKAIVEGEYLDPNNMISLSSDIEGLDLLRTELLSQPRKRGTGMDRIQMLSKPEMKTKGIPSPNRADALMMSFANPPVKSRKKKPIKYRARGAA